MKTGRHLPDTALWAVYEKPNVSLTLQVFESFKTS